MKKDHFFTSVYMITCFSSGLSALLPLHAAASSVQMAECNWRVSCYWRLPELNSLTKAERTRLKSSTRQMIKQFDGKINDDTPLLLSSAYYKHIVFSLVAEFISLMGNAVGSDSIHKVMRKITFVSDNVAQRSSLLSSTIISLPISIWFLPTFHSFFPRWLYFNPFEF